VLKTVALASMVAVFIKQKQNESVIGFKFIFSLKRPVNRRNNTYKSVREREYDSVHKQFDDSVQLKELTLVSQCVYSRWDCEHHTVLTNKFIMNGITNL
jgi:hypothetical protein